MSEVIERAQLAHFLDVEPDGASPLWALMGDGITELEVTANPETQEEQYIHQRSKTVFTKSYGPTIEGQQTCRKGDDVFEFIDEMSWKLPVGGKAQTRILEYREWMGGKAKMWNCNIVINSYGGAAEEPNSHSFTINIEGDPVFGTFDMESLTFTAEG